MSSLTIAGIRVGVTAVVGSAQECAIALIGPTTTPAALARARPGTAEFRRARVMVTAKAGRWTLLR